MKINAVECEIYPASGGFNATLATRGLKTMEHLGGLCSDIEYSFGIIQRNRSFEPRGVLDGETWIFHVDIAGHSVGHDQAGSCTGHSD